MKQSPFAAQVYAAAPFLLTGLYACLAVIALSRGPVTTSLVLLSLFLAAALIALSIMDLRTMRLPDTITLPLAAMGPILAYALGWGDPLWHIGSAMAGFLCLALLSQAYLALRRRAGLGLGDAKLLAGAGAWLGLEALPSVLLWACGAALLAVFAALLLNRRIEASTPIPFGPFLSLGFWLVWLYGPMA